MSLVFGAVLVTGVATGAWGQAGGSVPEPRQGAAARLPVGADLAGQDLSPEEARRLVGRSGDRWAAYYSPEEYADFVKGLDGEYIGVGLWVRRERDGGVAVSRVQQGTPAARAGIRTGDRLVRIDCESAARMPVTEVVARLRGSVGAGSRARASRQDPAGRSVDLAERNGTVGSKVTLAVRRAGAPVR